MLAQSIFENTGTHPGVGMTGFVGEEKKFNHRYCLHSRADAGFSDGDVYTLCWNYRCFKYVSCPCCLALVIVCSPPVGAPTRPARFTPSF